MLCVLSSVQRVPKPKMFLNTQQNLPDIEENDLGNSATKKKELEPKVKNFWQIDPGYL